MKKPLAVIALLAGAVSGYSQGQIAFSNYINLGGPLHAAVYPAQSAAASTYSATYGGYTGYEEVGQGTALIEKPPGTQAYVGIGPQGAAWDAQLLAGPAGITSLSGTVGGIGLVPVGTIAHFHTQTATAGMIVSGTTDTLPTEPYFALGNQVSVAFGTWSSAYPSLAAAQQSGVSGIWGISPVEQTTQAGGLTVAPAAAEYLPTTIESYSLAVTVPEPGTIALGLLGASSLLFRRRNT